MNQHPTHNDVRLRTRAIIEQHGVRERNLRSDTWVREFDLAFSKRLAKAGLLGLTWPKEYGGQGRTNVERLVVAEELLRAGAPVAAHWIGDRQIGPAILRYGSERLKTEILPLISSADAVFCLGMSEPQAGSDLASVATRAVPGRDGWKLHGHKIWTSHAHEATHMYVLARSNADVEKHAGLTEFIIDMDWPGIQVTPIWDMSGAHHFNEVHLDGVEVPHARVLGEIDNGWNQVIEQLSFERGGAERFLSTYQLFAHLVLVHRESKEVKGRLVAQLAALRTLCWEVARLMDEGVAPVVHAAALKI